MPPCRHFAGDLHAGRCADAGQNRLDIGFGVVNIDGATKGMRIAGVGVADQQARGMQLLIARLAAVKDRAHLEQGHIGKAARLIAGGGPQQTRQQIGAHVGHFRTDRIVDPNGINATTKQGGCRRIDKAVGDAFVIAKGRNHAPRRAFAGLQGRQNRLGHAGKAARQGFALQFGQAGDAGNLFDQIGAAKDVGPPAGRCYLVAVQGKAQRFQRFALIGLGDVHTDKADHTGGIKRVGTGSVGGGAVGCDVAGLTAAQIKDHLASQIQPRQSERRINTAFKAIARVRIYLKRPACCGNGNGIPKGGFNENIRGVRTAPRRHSPHDARQRFHAGIIGNRHLARAQGIGFAIKRRKLFPASGCMNAQRALDFGDIKHMQRAVQTKGEIVGDINKRRNRAQADGL